MEKRDCSDPQVHFLLPGHKFRLREARCATTSRARAFSTGTESASIVADQFSVLHRHIIFVHEQLESGAHRH